MRERETEREREREREREGEREELFPIVNELLASGEGRGRSRERFSDWPQLRLRAAEPKSQSEL